MSMNGPIKVKCIKENQWGLIVGKIYDAYKVKSNIKNKESILCVIDDFGEEYAFPTAFFEVVEND